MSADPAPTTLVFYANCLGRGGAHHSMLAWLELLHAQPEFRLRIFCGATGWFADELTRRGIPFELLPMPQALRSIRHGQWKQRLRTAVRVLTMTGGLLRAWSRIAFLPADGVVLTGGRDFIMLFPLAVRLRGRTATIPQTTDWGQIPVCRTMCRLAARTYAISEAVAESILRMGIPRHRVTVEPLIFTREFCPAEIDRAALRRELGLPVEAPVIGMAGVVRPHKGQREAVEVLALLRRRVPAARLLIVGVPPPDATDAVRYDAAVKERVAALGLQDAVHFSGWRADVSRVIRALDVMLVPSHDFEGVPRVILEGLEAALPIVASDLPQFREVLGRHDAGFLHPLNNLEAWADSIAGLLGDPDALAARQRQARAVWAREYSVASVRPRITAAFRRIADPST